MNNSESYGERYTLIYGLSANPVHQGHVKLVNGALENLLKLRYNVTQILIIPVYRRNPVGSRKDDLPKTYEHRIEMCNLAAQEVLLTHPDIPVSASRVEACLAINSGRPNYTAETLTYLKNNILTGMDLIFLISSELVYGANPEFSQWYKIDSILEMSSIALCPRPGFPINQSYVNALTDIGGRFIILDSVQTPDISSTVLRYRLQRGENPLALAQEGLIPFSIARYINKFGLYRNSKTNLEMVQFRH